jgi:hypothetical protein
VRTASGNENENENENGVKMVKNGVRKMVSGTILPTIFAGQSKISLRGRLADP